MKYSAVILALATGSLAAYYPESYPRNGTVYETIVTTAITTYCPYATEIVHNSKTYTVTKATTLTITDCPCTITRPVHKYPAASTVLYTSCPPEAPKKETYYPEPPKATGPAYNNPLTVVYPPGKKPDYPAGTPVNNGYVVGTATYVPTKATQPTVYTGAASANKVGSIVVGAAALAALAL